MYIPYKKMIAISGLAAFTMLGITAAKPSYTGDSGYKNLKVLSKNISDREMDYVMESFNAGLGANCLFCHPGHQNGAEFSIDYATDELENKRIARDMLRMTMKINQKYFNIKMNGLMVIHGRVTCRTCHQSSPVPILAPHKK